MILMENGLSGSCIEQGHTVLSFFLMAHPGFKSFSVRIKVAKVHCIAVSASVGPFKLTVIINADCTEEKLLPSVSVHISRHTVVITAAVSLCTVISGIKCPALYKFLILNVISYRCHSCIVTSYRNCRRMIILKIAYRTEKSVNTVSVLVTPAVYISAREFVINSIKCLSRSSVKKSIVFRPVQNISASVSVVFALVAYYLTCSVNCSVSCLAGHFRFSVSVKICYEELCVMLASTDISAEIDPPEPFAFKCVTVDENISRFSAL